MPEPKPRTTQDRKPRVDLLHLYEASVQCPDADIRFVDRLFRKKHGRPARSLREDFCGSSALSCEWVLGNKERTALGLDLDESTLQWARAHNVASIGDAAVRVELRCADVRSVTEKVDVALGLNFSYWIFKQREGVLAYFRAARRSLRPGGMLILDAFGGTESMCEGVDEKPIKASIHRDGTRVPTFTYLWRQHRFNPIDHHFVCYIEFKVRGRTLRRAFGYDWRFWTLAEIGELLREAGFRGVEVYADEFDEAGDSDGVYRLKTRLDNNGVWIAYVVGLT